MAVVFNKLMGFILLFQFFFISICWCCRQSFPVCYDNSCSPHDYTWFSCLVWWDDKEVSLVSWKIISELLTWPYVLSWALSFLGKFLTAKLKHLGMSIQECSSDSKLHFIFTWFLDFVHCPHRKNIQFIWSVKIEQYAQ